MNSEYQNGFYFVLKGDIRQKYITKYLCAKRCCAVYEENLLMPASNKLFNIIIAPVPCKNDMLERYINILQNCMYFIGGCIPDLLKKFCEDHSIKYCDYMEDEQFLKFNAVNTARGALLEAQKYSCYNIKNSRCIVFGYGKCGKEIALLLKRTGALVTVCARRSEVLKEAQEAGFKVLDYAVKEDAVKGYCVMFNTIPSMVMDRQFLEKIKERNVLIIDIASSPGGVDYEAAKNLNIKACLCPGLPGRYFPKETAQKVSDKVIEFVSHNIEGDREVVCHGIRSEALNDLHAVNKKF